MIGDILLKVAKYLPGLSTIFDKVIGNNDELEKMKMELEQKEIEGWTKHGRLTPKLYLKFGLITIFYIIFMIGILSLFFEDIASSLEHMLDMLVRYGKTILEIGE